MNPSDRPKLKIGVWRAIGGLGNYRLKQLLWPEGLPALVIGVGGAVAILSATNTADRAHFMGTLVQLSGTLLAIVFTALAILVALPAERYLRALQRDEADSDGMRHFLDPFLVAVGTQIAILILASAHGLVASNLSRGVEHAVFCAIGFLLIYGLLDIAALARSLVRHGVLRAAEAVRAAEAQENVHPLPERQSN